MTLPALIACDVDGTLINDDERVTPRTRDAVCAAVAAGTQFVLATGRPPRWIPPVVDQLGFAPLAVCANGAVIYDSATDQVLSAQTLAVDALAELAEIAARAIPGAGLAVERVARMTRPHHSSSARRATSTPGSTRTTPKCRSKTCSARPP
jgi:HAD superfamily hydrolase (TIGR01484 family)